MNNLLLAITFASLAVGFIILIARGSKPKVIEFSGNPEVKTSTKVRIVAGPTETFVSNVELGAPKQDWPPELQLRYPGATELNRIYTTLKRSIKLENLAQDNQVGGAQETIRFVSDAPPDRIFSWLIASFPGMGSN